MARGGKRAGAGRPGTMSTRAMYVWLLTVYYGRIATGEPREQVYAFLSRYFRNEFGEPLDKKYLTRARKSVTVADLPRVDLSRATLSVPDAARKHLDPAGSFASLEDWMRYMREVGKEAARLKKVGDLKRD